MPRRAELPLPRGGAQRQGLAAPRTAAAVLTLLAAVALPGQTAVDFRTPDGTRFVLIPIGGAPLVHWAVATPCGTTVDPASAPGTAAAAAIASLRGTWSTGSRDADREQQALAALDAAEIDLTLAPRVDGAPPTELQQKVSALRAEAGALCDEQAFRRVLAATPASHVRVAIDGDTALLQLTTTPFAVPAIARLLLERRESAALRSVRADLRDLQAEASAAWDQAPLSPLYAEALALAFPGHPLARSGDRPAGSGFQRALATATWARSQHPSRTVQVLLGNFDPAAVRSVLDRVFATTALPAPDPLPPASPRPPTAVRRALVPGARHPATVLAWTVPAGVDPLAVATAARWFAGGNGSWLHGELVRRGRVQAQVAVRAPWPAGASPGLLTIEVTDPGGGSPQLADEVLALCAARTRKAAPAGALSSAFGTLLHDFAVRTQRPLDHAGTVASRLLADPTTTPAAVAPHNVAFAEVPALLQRILDGHAIAIEWRDS